MAQNRLTGTCLCNNIAYQIILPASESFPQVVLCHCINCKRYTGSGFSANIIVPRSTFTYTKGSPKVYLDRGNNGGQVFREFCSDCGTPFTSRSGDEKEVAIKSGTLDEEHRRNCAKLATEIYCHRKDRWVDQMGNGEVERIDGSMG